MIYKLLKYTVSTNNSLFCTTMKKILFFLLISFLTSCLEVSKKEYIQKLDVLLEKTDSLSQVSEEISIQTADSLQKIRCGLLTDYTQHYPSDTITIETAQHIENIKFSCGNLRFFKQQKEVLSILQAKHKELIQLKKMIHQGSGDRATYESMIEQETESVENLKMNFQQLHTYYINGIRNFENSEHYLIELIEK